MHGKISQYLILRITACLMLLFIPFYAYAAWHSADDEKNGGSQTLTPDQADGYGLILAVTRKCPDLFKNRGWMAHIPRFYPEMLPNEVKMVDERWGWHMVQEQKLGREAWCHNLESRYVGVDKPLLNSQTIKSLSNQ